MSRNRVYFIKPIGMNGPIKIGCSASPDGRRSVLATWSPFALEVVAEIEGDFQLEQRFHARFLGQHERREWFTASPDLLATIAQIAAGKFDPSTLPPPKRLPSKLGKRGLGRKWSEEEKAVARKRRALEKIEREMGLVLPWPLDESLEDKFIADPARYGISIDERRERWNAFVAQRNLERAEQELARIKAAA